jgi:hypothetical protein
LADERAVIYRMCAVLRLGSDAVGAAFAAI